MGLPVPLTGHKCLKLFCIFSCSLGLGCGGAVRTQQAARIAQLESQAGELESQLTALKEQKLNEDREHCVAQPEARESSKLGAKSSPSGSPLSAGTVASTGTVSSSDALASTAAAVPSRPKASTPRWTGAPADLPVLRLAPTPGTTALAVRESPNEPATSIQVDVPKQTESNSEPAASSGSNSRPVLTVHGSQAGRIDDRALTPEERETGTAR